MSMEVEHAEPVELVLLAAFGRLEKPIAVSRFKGDPCASRRVSRTPANRDIDIVGIAGYVDEGLQPGPESVRHAQIHRMIPFANAKRPAVRLDALDSRRDDHIRICVAVSVCIRTKVIRNQIASHLKGLGDGLAMIAGYAGREILGRLDSPGSGLDG